MFSRKDMARQQTLEDFIRNKKIEFISYKRELDTNLNDFGEYNWNLVKHLTKHSGKYMTIKGDCLEEYLKDAKNLYYLAGFVVQLQYDVYKIYPDFGVHIDVDIYKFDNYKQPKEEKLVNGLGQVVCDVANWVPEIPYFEKTWNFALCDAIGGMVGYPGYEHPKSDPSFRSKMADHAENFMIGTPTQIERYKKYALDSLNAAITITEYLKKKPESIFEDDYRLYGLKNVADSARRIAEMVIHFSRE